jgi:hypothetical protein
LLLVALEVVVILQEFSKLAAVVVQVDCLLVTLVLLLALPIL